MLQAGAKPPNGAMLRQLGGQMQHEQMSRCHACCSLGGLVGAGGLVGPRTG
jgi:hypothetical protein